MPSVAFALPPIPGPTGPQTVRVDPNILSAEADANVRLGRSVQGAAETGMTLVRRQQQEKARLDARVKDATDESYLIGAQTKLGATQKEFESWAERNPDTGSWTDEWRTRQSAARDDAISGGENLNPIAKIRLKSEVDGWQTRGNARFGELQTTQNIRNAAGLATEGINQAISSNDAESAKKIIEVSVKNGVMSSAVGAAKLKNVTVGIATNEANADVLADPFNFKSSNYPDLPESSRVMMQFRAAKLSNETRTQTMRDWTQNVRDAQESGLPMPDREAVGAEAARQGIAPKWVDKLFTVPKTTSPQEFADASTELLSLNLVDDPTSEHMARAVAIVSGFKQGSYAQQRLERIVTERSDPNGLANSPRFKLGEESIKSAFNSGIYGKWKRPGTEYDDEGRLIPREDAGEKSRARVVMAKNMTLLQDYLKENPKARPDEIEKFVNGFANDHVATALKSMFAPSAFGLPKPATTKPAR